MESSKLYGNDKIVDDVWHWICSLLTIYYVAEIGSHSNTSTWIRDPFTTHPFVVYDKQAHDGSKDLCWRRFRFFKRFQIQSRQWKSIHYTKSKPYRIIKGSRWIGWDMSVFVSDSLISQADCMFYRSSHPHRMLPLTRSSEDGHHCWPKPIGSSDVCDLFLCPSITWCPLHFLMSF